MRPITYLRLSVTDRCDFRCVYCMAEDMTFVPRAQVLTLEEMGRLGRVLVELGVRRIRLTGGEPLLRRDIDVLIARLAAIEGIDDICLTTNGSLLTEQRARELKAAGVNRVTLSLDLLFFRLISGLCGGSRRGRLGRYARFFVLGNLSCILAAFCFFPCILLPLGSAQELGSELLADRRGRGFGLVADVCDRLFGLIFGDLRWFANIDDLVFER
mgnify:CR=1 FL=1